MPTVQANGVNLYYEMSGDHGDPMVLIHGTWGDHLRWQKVVPGLAKNFRVLTYDRRGHGQSEKSPTQGTAEEDAADISSLLEQLGLAPAHFVGTSFGATVSLKLAVKRPAVIRTLIIHEAPLFDLLANDPSYTVMLTELRRRRGVVLRALELGDNVGGACLFVETMASGPGQWNSMSLAVREIFINNAENFLDESKDPLGASIDLAALSQFEKPALLTTGGKSQPFFKPVVKIVAKAIKASKIENYPDDGHTPHISNPDEFVKRTTAFIKESGCP